MYQQTRQDVTYQDYPYPFAVSSSIEEIDIGETLDKYSSIWMRQKPLKGTLAYRVFEIDSSSVLLRFETKNETSLMKGVIKEATFEEVIEYDMVVRIPPKRRYTIQMSVKNVEKGELRIVEPDGILFL